MVVTAVGLCASVITERVVDAQLPSKYVVIHPVVVLGGWS